jgi:hypothetical protein
MPPTSSLTRGAYGGAKTADHNTRLHEYHRQLGFTHLQTVDLPHR